MKRSLSHLSYKSIESAPGAGYKIHKLLADEADIFISPGNPGYPWDFCAGHALLKPIGGGFRDAQNAEVNFLTRRRPANRGIVGFRDLFYAMPTSQYLDT